MKNIILAGSARTLNETMKNDGYRLTGIEISKCQEIQIWTYLLEKPDNTYDFETKIEFIVHEYDENDTPIAITVQDISCKLISE